LDIPQYHVNNNVKGENQIMSLIDPEAFLNEHYSYEINMLGQTLQHHRTITDNAIVKNALYVSFCVHARLLLDFFSSANPSGDDVVAQHFAPSWQPSSSSISQLVGNQRAAINKQVAHLTKTRENTSPIKEKDMQDIHDALIKDHQKFKSEVDSRYKNCFINEVVNQTALLFLAQSGTANVAISMSSVCTSTTLPRQ
jgi:hypothetical protein